MRAEIVSGSDTRIWPIEVSLKELAELGSPVDISVAFQARGLQLEIEQSGDCEIFELEDGRGGYMVDASMINQTSKSMYIADIEMRAPWEEDSFDWLVPKIIRVRDRKRGKESPARTAQQNGEPRSARSAFCSDPNCRY